MLKLFQELGKFAKAMTDYIQDQRGEPREAATVDLTALTPPTTPTTPPNQPNPTALATPAAKKAKRHSGHTMYLKYMHGVLKRNMKGTGASFKFTDINAHIVAEWKKLSRAEQAEWNTKADVENGD